MGLLTLGNEIGEVKLARIEERCLNIKVQLKKNAIGYDDKWKAELLMRQWILRLKTIYCIVQIVGSIPIANFI